MLNLGNHTAELGAVLSRNGFMHPGQAKTNQCGTNLLGAADPTFNLGNCYSITHVSNPFGE
jgi:hypothetical protein